MPRPSATYDPSHGLKTKIIALRYKGGKLQMQKLHKNKDDQGSVIWYEWVDVPSAPDDGEQPLA